ncbi:MAG: magnesium-protoporphyrin IX monomethyl ester (oxidative) cyclase, partial [Blastochloris sp.]|nr:magnesium-protoporphyrin IX monomethyl ester (oxidative) cyclase [Blastochloris sp.]
MEVMPDLSRTTRHALQEAILQPRFYTTDFDEIDRLGIAHMQDEFEWTLGQFANATTKANFVRNEEFEANFDDMPERSTFIDFLERSCTAEFSGCLLYAEMYKHLHDPTLRTIFKYMSRDEGRHAGFLNKSMRDLNVALDLGMLQTRKQYTHFKPKFIYYATYLSEKIGYARYITIYRHLQQHPQDIIHPIFKWFEQWCNDEYRHGEFFALLMRSQPELLRGANVRWIRFFLLAVYATMYLNDARRADFYAALASTGGS